MSQIFSLPNKPYYTGGEWFNIIMSCNKYDELEKVTTIFTYLLKEKDKVISNEEMEFVHHLILDRYDQISADN